MKACYVDTQDYNDCDGAGAGDKLGLTGLPMGSGAGQVSVNVSSTSSFVITAISRASNGGTHKFMVTESGSGPLTRSCTIGSGNDGGGCHAGSW
jgi:hypothetical protein